MLLKSLENVTEISYIIPSIMVCDVCLRVYFYVAPYNRLSFSHAASSTTLDSVYLDMYYFAYLYVSTRYKVVELDSDQPMRKDVLQRPKIVTVKTLTQTTLDGLCLEVFIILVPSVWRSLLFHNAGIQN